MKDHQIRELVNKLHDIAVLYSGTQQLRSHISKAVKDAGCGMVNSPVSPEGYCIMPLKLTAENGAKGALSGEFHISRTVTCHECGGEGCEDCSVRTG
ncbi:hypothetical protein CUU54_02435 [Pectobacterium polaris]|nr:hypothetical protein [Pectobacterium polaris]PWD54849.1 hypothetical protein DF209_21410 [Pectobacterium polaris]